MERRNLHIHGLRKLFPEALFIHIVRDVESVVRSMLNFHRVAGTQLVTNEEQAYKYWLRMVDACLKAEQSYGPRVIYRLQYAALIDNPEAAIHSLLDFVGEPYSAKCLEPLAQRINSSNVPVDFKSEDPATDPKVVEAARRLYAEIQQTPQPAEGSPAVADQLEAAFQDHTLKPPDSSRSYRSKLPRSSTTPLKSNSTSYNSRDRRNIILLKSESISCNLPGRNTIIQPKPKSISYRLPGSSAITPLKSETTKYNSRDRSNIIPLNSKRYKTQLAKQERHYAAELEESTKHNLPSRSDIIPLNSKSTKHNLPSRSGIMPLNSMSTKRNLPGRSTLYCRSRTVQITGCQSGAALYRRNRSVQVADCPPAQTAAGCKKALAPPRQCRKRCPAAE